LRKAISLIALGIMAIGLVFVAFGTQILPTFQAVYPPPTNTYPVTGIVYYMQTTQPNLTLNYIGAGIALLGAVVFGATYPTKADRLPVRLLPRQI
jgi:hypothetical protein